MTVPSIDFLLRILFEKSLPITYLFPHSYISALFQFVKQEMNQEPLDFRAFMFELQQRALTSQQRDLSSPKTRCRKLQLATMNGMIGGEKRNQS
jgi:hypothetical protein